MNSDNPPCYRCGNTNTKLRRQIIRNGTAQIAWWCGRCHRWAERCPHWLPHGMVAALLNADGKKIGDLPTVQNSSKKTPCIICGEPGEEHHFAPRIVADAFGDDWEKWPTAFLCIKHHLLWHRVVTPHLNEDKKHNV